MKIDSKGAVLAISGLALTLSGVYGSIATSQADEAPSNVTHQVTRPPLPQWMNRPCKTTNSLNCFWHATDPHGVSYWIRKMPNTGKRHPLVCQIRADGSGPRFDQCWRYQGGGM